MATTTTNLGLTKPSGTDKIRIAQINGNMDILDDKIGAVGNTSLQAQVTSANQALSKITNHTELTGTTVANFQNAILTLNGQMSNGEERAIFVSIGTASGVFKQMSYYGTVTRSSSTRLMVSLQTYSLNADQKIIGTYSNGDWTWNELALKQTYEVKTYSIDCTTATNVGGKYVGTKDLSGLSEMTGVKATVPMFARKSGYSYICTVEVESTTVRIQSDVSVEGVTVGILFIY